MDQQQDEILFALQQDEILFGLHHAQRMLRKKDEELLAVKADAFDIINDMFKQLANGGPIGYEPDYIQNGINNRITQLDIENIKRRNETKNQEDNSGPAVEVVD